MKSEAMMGESEYRQPVDGGGEELFTLVVSIVLEHTGVTLSIYS